MTETSKKPSARKKPAARTQAKTVEPKIARAAAQKPSKPKIEAPRAPAAPSRTSNNLVHVLIGAIVVSVVVAGGFALWPKLSSYLDVKNDPIKASIPAGENKIPEQTIEEMAAERDRFISQLNKMMERVNELDQALQSVKKLVAATDQSMDAEKAGEALERLKYRFAKMDERGADLAKLKKRVDKIEESKETAKNAPTGNDLTAGNEQVSTAVAQINQRLENLEKTKAAATGAAARALVLATSQLRQALHDDAPFVEPLRTLEAVAEGNQKVTEAVAALSPHAEKGVSSLTSLRNRFDSMASKAANAAKLPEGAGWVQKTINRLTSLASVRQVDGGGDENSLDGVLFRAGASLKSGDLMNAVKTLEELDGAAGAAAETWLKDARARLAVERAMASLHVYAVSILAPKE